MRQKQRSIVSNIQDKQHLPDRVCARTHLGSEHLKHSDLLAKLTTLQDGHSQSPAAQGHVEHGAPLEGIWPITTALSERGHSLVGKMCSLTRPHVLAAIALALASTPLSCCTHSSELSSHAVPPWPPQQHLQAVRSARSETHSHDPEPCLIKHT